ncbi:uncharacterized protein LOC129172966 isoform X2 [Dunckerocampus dactyliophorus]|uniref:uncharacterized protein LOC129172966 isoform X2 n=1 Tax=Dunckerocampus dactyliophorus TaxID=161453 RepID=UPI0024072A50|nr:uncharacterized protein LOC129172966 isoform X2 [Dunckerocampus dactyliophorus]
MDCKCETGNSEEALPALPALIRWPIRLFCSITGLSALWGWVSRLVGTLRGIQSLCKWLSRIWKFFVACSSKFKWMLPIIRAITGSSSDGSLELESIRLNLSSPLKADLRLILLGPAGGGRTSVANTLLGCSVAQADEPLTESTIRRSVINGREVTVIDTPDLLGPSLGRNHKAREALRSVQLASPGPHAILLVMQAPRSSENMHQYAMRVIQATLELFGDGVLGYIIPVLTNADCLGRKRTADFGLLDVDAGSLKTLTSLCGQRPVLLDTRPDQPPEVLSMTRRELVGRVMELKALRVNFFVHELQRREERFREELLGNMTSALARKMEYK